MAAVRNRDPLPHLRGPAGIGRGLRAVMRRCCTLPAQLKSAEPDKIYVHRARQALKRARAVLRLGEMLGVARAKSTRRRLARLARKLSPLRDATVIAEMAKKISRRTRGAAREAALAMTGEPSLRRAGWWTPWKRRLAAEAENVTQLGWPEIAPHDVERALQHSAKRVQRRARKTHDIVAAHEWRKAVIVLREQVATLRPLLGGEAQVLHENLYELSRQLGRATDLYVFLEAVKRRRWPKKLRAARDELKTVVRAKRDRVIKKALKCWPDVCAILRRDFE